MRRLPLLFAFVTILFPAAAMAQDFDQVEIRATEVTPSIYMLEGEGGNIAVCIGDDGTFIVDDQFAPLTEKIKAAIDGINGQPVQFVINTHFHYDHTDGNESFGGEGAIIVSHENSRRRMSVDQVIEMFQYEQAAYTAAGLPKITFTESMRFHYNGQTIDVFHVANAHTDGDAIVWFREANVIHPGDVFVRYGLPFIDGPNGGSINGMIDAVARLAAISDDQTRFIPGHGPVSTKADLQEFGDMLVAIRDRVQTLIDEGASLEEVVAANPTEGYTQGPIPPEGWIGVVYAELTERR